MTENEILAIKPGKELNAMVAEHVFGWRKVPGPTTDYDGPCESFDVLVPPTIDDPFPLYPPRGAIKPWYFCSNWSTGLTAAWELREHIHRTIGGTHIISVCDELTELCKIWNGIKYIEAKGYTTPEAICKAALIAKIGGKKL